LLAIAAGIEKWSEHPLAQAVVERAKGVVLKSATHFKALVGRGAQARINGQTMYVGNLRLFEELGCDLGRMSPSWPIWNSRERPSSWWAIGKHSMG